MLLIRANVQSAFTATRAHCWLLLSLSSKTLILWFRAAPWSVSPQAVLLRGLILPQVQDYYCRTSWGSSWPVPSAYQCPFQWRQWPPAYPLLANLMLSVRAMRMNVQLSRLLMQVQFSILVPISMWGMQLMTANGPSNHYSLSLVAQPAFAILVYP